MAEPPPHLPSDPHPPWFSHIYPQLRAIAQRYFADERQGKGADAHTLSPTALVHEAYLKLHRAQQRGTLQPLQQHQFFPAAARAMRQILIDHARKRRARLDAESSSQHIRHTKPDVDEGTRIIDLGPSRADDLIDLDAAITSLEAFDPEAAQLVQLRFFAGLSVEQAADVMGVGRTTAEGWWRLSRAWLTRKLCE